MKPFRIYARLSMTKGDDVSVGRQIELGHAAYQQRRASSGDVFHNCDTDDFIEPKGSRSGGSDKNRPAYRKLITTIEQSKTPGILWSYDLSRITRADDLMMTLLKLKQLSQEVDTYRDDIDLSTLTGRTNIRIKGMFNAWYREESSERLTNYYAGARRNNWVYHRKPTLGLLLEGKGAARHFVKDQETFHTVIAFCELVAKGHSIRDSARQLYKSHKARTRQGTLRRLDYYHLYQVKQQFQLYKPFLPPALYNKCVRRFAELSNGVARGRKSRRPSAILSRLLFCKDCGVRYSHTFEHPGKDHAPDYIWRSYRHGTNILCPNMGRVAAHKLEDQLWLKLDAVIARLATEPEFTDYQPERPTAPDTSRREQIKQELAALEENFQSIITSKQTNITAAVDLFNQKRDALEKELSELHNEPAPPLAPEEIDAIAASAAEWRNQADKNPAGFNLLLRDIFERITVDGENHLEFFPQRPFVPLFG